LQISKTIFRVQNALTFSPDTEDYVQRSWIVINEDDTSSSDNVRNNKLESVPTFGINNSEQRFSYQWEEWQ